LFLVTIIVGKLTHFSDQANAMFTFGGKDFFRSANGKKSASRVRIQGRAGNLRWRFLNSRINRVRELAIATLRYRREASWSFGSR
jgi:hypothetical protein